MDYTTNMEKHEDVVIAQRDATKGVSSVSILPMYPAVLAED